MSPEVKQFLDAHPGYTTEGPDANGIIVYRAPDGNYINVRQDGSLAMRGFSQPSGNAQQTPTQPEQPAASQSTPGSGKMDQLQLEALLKQIAQNGNTGSLEFNQGTKSKTVRSGGLLGGETETVQVPYVQWINRATGQTIEADVEAGGGGYTVTFNGVKKENQGAQATTPTQAQAQPRQSRPNPNDPKRMQEFDPDANGGKGAWVDAGPNQKEVDAQAERNKPKPQQAPDGSWGYFDTTKNPPVWQAIQGPGAAAPKPVQVNGQWGVWQPNSSDPKQPPTFVTIEVPKPGVTLKNVDTWEPDFSQPDLGIGKWAASQRQKIGLSAEQGGITQDDYDNSVKDVLGRATTTISNVTSANTVQRQRQQDEEGLRRQRSEEADTDFSRAMGAFSGLVSKGGFDPDSGSLKQVIPGLLWEMKNNREQREATAPKLPALHPMFQIASAQSAATAQPPAAKEQVAGTGPTPAPYQPPGQPAPNAAPAAPVAAAPVAPPTPAVAAPAMAAPPPAPPAAPNPNIGQPGEPMMSQPSVPTTSAHLPGPSPEPLPPPGINAPPAQLAPWPAPSGGILPGANPIPSDMPIDTTPPPQPSTYGDGGDMQKTSLGSGPLSSFASNALAPAPAAPTVGQGGPLDSLAQQSNLVGGWDPIQEAAKLVSMGVPRDIATQALMGSGVLDEQTRRRLGMVAA